MTELKKHIIAAAGVILLAFSWTLPCEYNIRDSGFVEINPRPFRLYFYVDDATPQTFIRSFDQTAHSLFKDTNILPEIIDIQTSENVVALDYYRFWQIDAAPALILASPDKRSMRLPLGRLDKDFKRQLWTVLDGAVTSPVRSEILSHIVRSYAIILLVEGGRPRENKAVRKKIQAAKKSISRLMTQLPKRIEKPPYLIALTPSSQLQEQVLLWSLGLSTSARKGPVIAILFGRGRLFMTPIEGNKVSDSQLTNILSALGLACDCGLDKRGMMGQRIPLKWDAGMQVQVVRQLGFDAENPMIKREIAGILSTDNYLSSASSPLEDQIKTSFQELDFYSESRQAFGRKFGSNRLSPVQNQNLNASNSPRRTAGFRFARQALAGAVFIFIILATGLTVLIRSRRKKR